MLNDIKTIFEIIKKSAKINLNFANQIGGKIKIYSKNKGDYYYNIEYGKPTDNNMRYEIYLLTVNDGSEGCGLIIVDKERNEANIQSVSNFSNCIICKDENIKYKVGAILIQIIIHECKNLKLKRITLEDNSKINFTGSSIELIYYRTITQGTPYYTKFGFKNNVPLKINDNKNIWKQKPSIDKKELIKILMDNVEKKDDKIIILFNKILNLYKNNIVVEDFLLFLFNKALNRENEITKKRDNGDKQI
jgi:hypothetical protein